MNKQQLLAKVETAWAELKEAYTGLNEAQLTLPGVTGEWSVRDILAHVTTWEEEALKYFPLILEGKRPPRYKDLYGGVDAFNAHMTEAKRSLSLSEVLQQFEDTHHKFVEAIDNAPEEQFVSETRFRRRVRLDSYSHYPVHAQTIREWRERSI